MGQVAIIGVDPKGKGRAFLSEVLLPTLQKAEATLRGEGIPKFKSDAKSWGVTVGEVTSIFDFFESYSGPFLPGTQQVLARDRIKNNGLLDGNVYLKFERLNADGTPAPPPICNLVVDIPAGYCCSAYCTIPNVPCAFTDPRDCIAINPENLAITIPETPGTYYYGVKTWGADEAEPSYPAPIALMAAIEVEEESGIVKLIKCMFPRLMTKTPTPRITNKEMTPRIDCIKETGIIPLQSRTGALGATRGQKLEERLRARAITVNGVKYKEI